MLRIDHTGTYILLVFTLCVGFGFAEYQFRISTWIWSNVQGQLGIIGWDPSVSKCNHLHVDIFQFFFFIILGYIPWNTPKWSVIVPKSRTSTGYFSNSSGSSVTSSSSRFSPFIDLICPFCRHSCTIHRYAMHSLFDFKKGGLQKYAPMRALSC